MRDVVGYENIYGVTSCGKIWSYKYKKFLKPRVNRGGYFQVDLMKNGERKTYSLHRIVAEAYLPNLENLPQVNHKDENKANNCVNNLEWCDCKYNNNYGTRNEKVANSHKIPILQFDLNGNFIREWGSASDVGREVKSTICKCLKGKYKQAYGSIWKYKE